MNTENDGDAGSMSPPPEAGKGHGLVNRLSTQSEYGYRRVIHEYKQHVGKGRHGDYEDLRVRARRREQSRRNPSEAERSVQK